MGEHASAAPLPSPAANRRFRRMAASLLMALCCMGFAVLCIKIDRYGQRDHAHPADAIVILGCRVEKNGLAGDSLRSRTLKAVELYRQGQAPAIICTGGVGPNPPAESAVAACLAIQHGVPATAIYRESRSTDTYENAKYAADICRKHGWKRLIVVSDPYHLYRARLDFSRFNLTAYTSPAPNCRRNRIPIQRMLWTMREALAILRDAVEYAR